MKFWRMRNLRAETAWLEPESFWLSGICTQQRGHSGRLQQRRLLLLCTMLQWPLLCESGGVRHAER